MNALEENIGNIWNLRVEKNFLHMTPKRNIKKKKTKVNQN